MFVNNATQNKPMGFYCEKCYFNTSNKKDYSRHLKTKKHIFNDCQGFSTDFTQKPLKISYDCDCGKSYKDSSGLWRHKKKCNNNSNTEFKESQNSDFKMLAELFKLQMNENQEFKDLIVEQNKQLIEKSIENQKLQQQLLEMVGKVGSTTNNTNCHNNNNNQFNLQFFLNETCKDALNIEDFVEQIKLQLSDLDMIGRVGYVEGMSKIFLRNLNELDVFKRPIHCSDLKRETMYVKDKDSWEKENGENVKITRAIKQVEHKNIKQIPQWREENPTAEDTDTKKHIEYQKILLEAMGGSTLEDDNKKREKIIRNIAKEVVIEKKQEK